jgi:hypothetical protein
VKEGQTDRQRDKKTDKQSEKTKNNKVKCILIDTVDLPM